MTELRSAWYICAEEISSRDPCEGLQVSQNLVLFGQSNNTGAIDVKIDRYVLEEKLSLRWDTR